jgi:poly(3-hydroxybutyrate) depolymerase
MRTASSFAVKGIRGRLLAAIAALAVCHCGAASGGGDGAHDGSGGSLVSGTGGGVSSTGSGGLASAGGGGGATSAVPSAGTGGATAPAMSGAGGMQSAAAGSGGMTAMSTGGTGAPDASMPEGSGAPAAGDAAPSEGCGVNDVPASGDKTIDVDGTQRAYIVTVPSPYDPDKPHRLIFAWHGLGGTAMQIASSYYGLQPRAEGSAIFIAAQGLAGSGQQSGLASWPNTDDGDITFTRKMLDWAKMNYCIDTKRVFSIGMSNGGLMSNIVGCELGDSFRAIVAMSGGGPMGYAMKSCSGQIAVWISHGNMDDNVPFSYGEMSRDYWTMANHCGTSTMPVMPGTCLEYQDCDTGFPVQFSEFDGGHMVPSFASEAGWNFFAQF